MRQDTGRAFAFRALFSVLGVLILAGPVDATLTFYYDPATGNVAFDASQTRSGVLHSYVLSISPLGAPPIEFLSDNWIKLSNSGIYAQEPRHLFDTNSSGGWQGLYTIGNVLPPGLSEEFWTTYFASTASAGPGEANHGYVDIIGAGVNPPPAAFVYGPASGTFNNAQDLIDPDAIPWAEQATLVYYSATGEVAVDTTGPNGGYITLVALQSNGGLLPDGFAPDIAPGPMSEATENRIFLLGDVIEPGLTSLGRILPTGLSRSGFENRLTSAKFLGKLGFGLHDADLATSGTDFQFAVVAVPEPSSLVVASGMTVAGAVACRRQRRRTTPAIY